MKKMLITGHRGLLGSACARRFSGHFEILSIPTNILDEQKTRSWFSENRPDYVVHAAAKVGGVKANREYPVEFLLDNIKMQNVIIESCYTYGVEKLINVATSCLFPKLAPLPVSEESLLTGPFEPDVEAYAIAKLAGYRLCKAYAEEYSQNYMTVAPCNLYGLNDNYGPSAHVIPALMSRLKKAHEERKPLVVWGDGTAIREFMYADDAANSISYVLHQWNSPELINIGTGIGTNIRSLVEALIDVSGLSVEVQYDTSQPTGIYRKTFSIKKLERLGFGPLFNLREGLLKTWIDFIENPNPRFK